MALTNFPGAYVLGENVKENLVLKGSLNLCDLAGSERLDRSGAVRPIVWQL